MVSRLELSESGSCKTEPVLSFGDDISDSDKERGPGELPLVLFLLTLSLRAGDLEGVVDKDRTGASVGEDLKQSTNFSRALASTNESDGMVRTARSRLDRAREQNNNS